MANRGWNPAESRLLSEWLSVRYPGWIHLQRIRLGPLPPALDAPGLAPEERAALGGWRRWADAIALSATELHLIEAMVVPKVGKISQLQLYLRLLPSTPELREYLTRRVTGVLLCAMEDPIISDMAGEAGLVVEVYHPDWIDMYLGQLSPRTARPSL